MGHATRKQYLYLGGCPLVVHALRAFDDCPSVEQLLLILPRDDLAFGRDNLLAGHAFRKKIRLVAGGETRQSSVFNGIRAIEKQDDIVVIHDGVRPFVRPEQIEACITHAARNGACILGVPVNDTLKRIDRDRLITATVPREKVWRAQTPQAFRYALIAAAHESARREGFTASDDALLLERLGEKVGMIHGSEYNIKITTPEDLALAERIFEAKLF